MTDTTLEIKCENSTNCSDVPKQPGATMASPIILSVAGVMGQALALYFLNQRSRQQSRTVFYVMLATLLWTDIIGKVTTTPFALIAYYHEKWVGGIDMCNLHGFLMMTIGLVTHCLVSAMAVERYIGIKHGYYYNKIITAGRAKAFLLAIWLFSVLFCIMPMCGIGQYALQYPGTWCFVNFHVEWGLSPVKHIVYTNAYGGMHLLCIVVIVYCNFAVIGTLIKARVTRFREPPTTRCSHKNARQRELEIQMVLVLIVITLVFIISWLPLDLRIFLNQIWPHRTRKDHFTDMRAVRMASLNQIIDPWAYIICRKLFFSSRWRKCLDYLQGRSNREHSNVQVWVSPRRASLASSQNHNAVNRIAENDLNLNLDEESASLLHRSSPYCCPPNTKRSTSSISHYPDGSDGHSCKDSGTESMKQDFATTSVDDTSVFVECIPIPSSGSIIAEAPYFPYATGIPIFTSESYSLRSKASARNATVVYTNISENKNSDRKDFSHRSLESSERRQTLRRLQSTYSADVYIPLHSKSSHITEHTSVEEDPLNLEVKLEEGSKGRRHSWSNQSQLTSAKHFRSRSTQTSTSVASEPVKGHYPNRNRSKSHRTELLIEGCGLCAERTIIEEASKKLKQLKTRSSSTSCEQDSFSRCSSVVDHRERELHGLLPDSNYIILPTNKKTHRNRFQTLSLSNNVLETYRSKLHMTHSVPISKNIYMPSKSRNDQVRNSHSSLIKKVFPSFKDKNSKSLDTLFGVKKSKEDVTKLVEDSSKSQDILSDIKDATEIVTIEDDSDDNENEDTDEDLNEIIIPGDRHKTFS